MLSEGLNSLIPKFHSLLKEPPVSGREYPRDSEHLCKPTENTWKDSGGPASRLTNSITGSVGCVEMQLLNPQFILQADCTHKAGGGNSAPCSTGASPSLASNL